MAMSWIQRLVSVLERSVGLVPMAAVTSACIGVGEEDQKGRLHMHAPSEPAREREAYREKGVAVEDLFVR